MKELFESFAKFQGECPTIEKNKTGAWGKYADLTAILETVKPLLSKHGLSISQFIQTENDSQYIVTKLFHKLGDQLSSSVKIDYKADNVQKYGSLITYYKRYAISAMLAVVSDDDVDDVSKLNDKAHEFKKIEKVSKKLEMMTSENIKSIEQLLDTEEVKKWFMDSLGKKGITSLKQLEDARFNGAVSAINKYKESLNG